MRSVVFVNQGVGDVIMHLPLLRAVTSLPTDAALFVTRSVFEQQVISMAVDGRGAVSFVDVARAGESRFAAFLRIGRAIRGHRPDVVALGIDVHPWLGALQALMSGARIRIGPAAPFARYFFNRQLPYRNPTTDSIHNVEYACRAAELLGRPVAPKIRMQQPPTWAAVEADKLLRSLSGSIVAVAMGSGPAEPHKRPSPLLCRQIISQLTTALPQSSFVLLGSSVEADLNASIAAEAAFRGIDLTGRTPDPLVLVAVLRRCRVLVSACNGLSHFAALAGRPVIGLFGPTNPAVTGPFGVPLRVISRHLECSPCYRRGFRHGCGRPVCMELDVTQVTDAVREVVRVDDGAAREHAQV